eukprot:6399965-Amphidinium_carterae.1
MRLTQALFFDDAIPDKFLMCKLQLYVDDPIGVLTGTIEDTELRIQTILLLWSALRFDLATDKLHVGQSVPWCGVQYHAMPDKLIVTIKQNR